MSSGDPNVWQAIVDFLWIPLGAAVAAVWALLTGRIRTVEVGVEMLKDRMITKDDFLMHTKNEENNQRDIKEAIKEQKAVNVRIFDQIRELEKMSHERHIELVTIINNNNGNGKRTP